ncbi:MAG TPA: serine/threonine-protein kinase [Kofleriaceae bacterium]|nr:serine/threonine-protein kinase [Kofleriaceae bacterium]
MTTDGRDAIDPMGDTTAPAIDPIADTNAASPHEVAAAASMSFLAPGFQVGRYRIDRKLGAGGMGVVYAADDPELGRQVAVKVLRRGSTDPALRLRLAREAQAMARVSHPNVITVHDVGVVDGQLFVAMELVAGESLREWMARPHTRREIVDVFVAAGRGLAAAHAAGIIHRDFKPDNVLMSDGRARVTDFGLARDRGEQEPRASSSHDAVPVDPTAALTLAGDVLGTPAYMAPEQHAGEHVGARADQFSFAVALYEALYGARPFPEGTYDELVDAVRAGRLREPPPGPGVPGSLRRILLRALSPRAADRFPGMPAMLDALSRDRTRVPRQVARVSLALLVSVAVAFGADWIARGRAMAVSHSSFASARAQLGQLLRFRDETFTAIADLVEVLPILRRVTAANDQADFGLGAEEDDAANLAAVHEQLVSASWDWLSALGGNVLAVADYKGRLVYTSADQEAWGADVTVVPVLGQAFAGGGEVVAGLVRGADPALAATRVLGRSAEDRVYVLFSRAMVPGDLPEALFVVALPGHRLLEDVSPGGGTRLSLLTPDGTAEGTVPAAVLARATDTSVREVAVGGDDWLVQRQPLGRPDASIGQLVLARRLDVGLAGLFAGARLILGLLGALLVVVAGGSLLLVRRG